MVRCEQQLPLRLEQTDQPRRVPRTPHDSQVEAAPVELVAILQQTGGLGPGEWTPSVISSHCVGWESVAGEPILVKVDVAAFGDLQSMRQQLSPVFEDFVSGADVVRVPVGDQQPSDRIEPVAE